MATTFKTAPSQAESERAYCVYCTRIGFETRTDVNCYICNNPRFPAYAEFDTWLKAVDRFNENKNI